jgi:hypothetical protein
MEAEAVRLIDNELVALIRKAEQYNRKYGYNQAIQHVISTLATARWITGQMLEADLKTKLSRSDS